MVILLLYAAFCIWLAYRDADKIRKGIRPDHSNNGILHGMWVGLMLFYCLFTHAWLLFLAMPFVGKLMFDMALNLFRKKKWDYVSREQFNPKYKDKVSKLDRLEYSVFKSGATPKAVYLLIIIILITLHYV